MPKIFKTIDKLRPIYDWTDKITMILCKLLLIADILIACYSVAGRLIGGAEIGDGKFIRDYVPFLKDPAWTEEVVLTLMSYMAVLSAAIAIRHEKHIRMDAFDAFLPKKLLLVLNLLSDAVVLFLGVIMLTSGWKYATGLGSFGKYVSIPWLSKFWQYFPIPLAGAAMILFELEQIVNHLKAFFIKEEKEDAE